MKVNITVAHTDGSGEPWIEDYNRPEVKNIDDANAYAIALIEGWNSSLRPYEKARRVVLVEIVGESGPTSHDWEKTNLVTISDRLGLYDTLECRNCFITAKRFGLTNIHIDRQFRAKKFQTCVKK